MGIFLKKYTQDVKYGIDKKVFFFIFNSKSTEKSTQVTQKSCSVRKYDSKANINIGLISPNFS